MKFLAIVWFDHAREVLRHLLNQWFDQAVELAPRMLIAVISLILFYTIAKISRSPVRRMNEKLFPQPTIASLFSRLVYYGLWLMGVFAALSILRLDKSVISMLAGLGILGIALGFAFQDIAANFISGVILSFKSPFKIGDFIDTNGFSGVIMQIDLRSTIIRTLEGKEVHLPNKLIFQNPLVNASALGKSRIEFTLMLDHEVDLGAAQALAEKTLKDLPFHDDTDVMVSYGKYLDQALEMNHYFWIRSGTISPQKAKTQALIAVSQALKEAGIPLAKFGRN